MTILKDIQKDLGNIKSERPDLVDFAFVMACACTILGGLLLWKGRPANFGFWAGAAFFSFSGLFLPEKLKLIQRAWMTLALTIGWFMTRVILSVIFFLLVTPMAAALRLSGKKFLDVRFRTDEPTYWRARPKRDPNPEIYEKQF